MLQQFHKLFINFSRLGNNTPRIELTPVVDVGVERVEPIQIQLANRSEVDQLASEHLELLSCLSIEQCGDIALTFAWQNTSVMDTNRRRSPASRADF